MLLTNDYQGEFSERAIPIEPAVKLHDAIPAGWMYAMEQLVTSLLPEALLEELQETKESSDKRAVLFRLLKHLPIIRYPEITLETRSISVTCLCPAEYTNCAGRYVADTLTKWLYPGKHLVIPGAFNLNFRFKTNPGINFFLVHNVIAIQDPSDIPTIQRNIGPLAEEIRLNIMAVYQARYITSLKSQSNTAQHLLMRESLSTIFREDDANYSNLHDRMEVVMRHSTVEAKIDEVKKNISTLMSQRPKTFDRDVFYEIAQYASLFRDPFSLKRDPRHMSRIIAYQYLFKKTLCDKVERSPHERHVIFKVFKHKIHQPDPVIGVLIGFNLLRETERFEARHLKQAIANAFPNASIVPDSTVADRNHDKMRFFYCELAKSTFSLGEIKEFAAKFPKEIVRQIETVVHPLFMPRNEEELMRNLIVLSKQIKFVRELPQVSIHYDMQSESYLIFTVIIVRLIKKGVLPMSESLNQKETSLKFDIDDIRVAGYLKNKYPKEASILRTTVDKSTFFRPDYSVDLLRARQKIVLELTKILGEFRDFNGGIILKQDEALSELRRVLGPMTRERELLLENYFYSLRPGIMQTVYPPLTLKVHFELLLQALYYPLEPNMHHTFSCHHDKYYLLFIKAVAPSFKEIVQQTVGQMQIPSHDLTTTFLQVDQVSLMGMILRIDHMLRIDEFEAKIQKALNAWDQSLACPVSRL
ncbi:MAG: hypothetical protein RL235_87 [Chlamydiota bacterium]|jgi:hypothetical protein